MLSSGKVFPFVADALKDHVRFRGRENPRPSWVPYWENGKPIIVQFCRKLEEFDAIYAIYECWAVALCSYEEFLATQISFAALSYQPRLWH